MMTTDDDLAPAVGRRTLVLSMVASGVVVAIARWAFSGDRRVFHVSPDEPSQMAVARWLAGERRWNMFDHATWQPGLGTLLTPIYWITDDGETAVRLALGFNAVIAGASAAVFVVLTRRLTGLTAPWCALIATLTAISPASLSASSFVWAEPLVSLSFVATLAALMRWYETDRLAMGIAAVAIAIAGFTAHSRLLPLVGVTVLLAVGRAVWRRRWGQVAALCLTAGALFAASAAWTHWILSNVWDDPNDQNTVDAVWDRARKLVAIADSALGQAWYQLAATLGIALIGMAVVVRAAVRRRGPIDVAVADEWPRPIDARILIATTLPLLVLSAVFMADRPRPDQHIYGRYNDAIMWPIIAVGLAWVGRRAVAGFERRHYVLVSATAVAILGLGAAVDALHGDAIRERYGVRGMIAGLLAFVDRDDTLDVWQTSLMSAALFVSIIVVAWLARVSWMPRRGGMAVLGLGAVFAIGLLAVATIRTERVADLRLNGWSAAAAVAEVETLVPTGEAVGVRPVPNSRDPVVNWVPQRQRFQLYQLFLPGRSFVRDRGVDDDVGPYVFAPLRDPEMLEGGAKLIWQDPSIRVGLWKEPTSD